MTVGTGNLLDHDVLREGAHAADVSAIVLPPRRAGFRLAMQLSLIVLDSAMLFAGFAFANLVWIGSFQYPYNVGAAATFVPLYIAAGFNGGAFSADSLPSVRVGIFRSVRAILLAALGVVLIAFFVKTGEHISRIVLLAGSLVGASLLIACRSLFHRRVKRFYGARLHSEVVILDDCEFDVPPGVFTLDARASRLRSDVSDPMMLDRIGRLLAPADRVVIVCRPERRRNWAMVLKGANIRGEVVSPELTDVGPLGTGHFGRSATVIVAAGSLSLRQRMMKRALDLALAICLIALLAPMLVLIALAIRLDSPGPIFFIQDRVGRGNRLFGIYKFRSMRADSCDRKGDRSASRDDDRITRVGRFIRATSIDELPQLINILRGEMSFVGPRPHALGSLAGDLLFWEVDERYWHRHVCKPGMTGLAQIRGYRGATHAASDLVNRLQADLEYVSGWTILRDISILFATLRVVVHRNAY